MVLNNATSIYIINNRLRFINELWPSKDVIYARTDVVLIKGIGIAAITI